MADLVVLRGGLGYPAELVRGEDSGGGENSHGAKRTIRFKKLSHREKQFVSTEEGIQTDESDGQRENADSSIRESLDPGSTVTIERFVQPQKHLGPRASTEEGMQIDESNEQFENTRASIRESLEPDSNAAFERRAHPKKQALPIYSTDEGMQIDESDDRPEKADASIRESLDPG
jgi:hypothetical protein